MGTYSDICVCSNCENETLKRTVCADDWLFEDCPVCGHYVQTIQAIADRDELLEMRRDEEEQLEGEELEDFRQWCEAWDRKLRGESRNIFEEEECPTPAPDVR